jgi:putative PIN family toxin of toxin-antitoxin system
VAKPLVVIDTNVFISGLRSRRGASFKLLSMLGEGAFDISVSVPLVLEYETIARRQARALGLDSATIDDILDYLCQVALRREIFFLWRPFLKDPKDDLVLELAVESESEFIITYNRRDFAGTEKFGIKVLTPKEFLKKLGEIT